MLTSNNPSGAKFIIALLAVACLIMVYTVTPIVEVRAEGGGHIDTLNAPPPPKSTAEPVGTSNDPLDDVGGITQGDSIGTVELFLLTAEVWILTL